MKQNSLVHWRSLLVLVDVHTWACPTSCCPPPAMGQSPQLSPVLACGFGTFGVKREEPGTGRAEMMVSLLLSWLMSLLLFWIELLIVQRISSIWEVLKTCIKRCLSTVTFFFSPVNGTMEVRQPLSPNFDPRLLHGFMVRLNGATA